MQNQNNLQHTGVMGMKWGHRKAPTTLSSTGKISPKKSRIIGLIGERRREFDKETKDARKERTRLRTESRKNYAEWRKTGKESYRKLAEKYHSESYSEFCNKGSRMTNGEAAALLALGLSSTAIIVKFG